MFENIFIALIFILVGLVVILLLVGVCFSVINVSEFDENYQIYKEKFLADALFVDEGIYLITAENDTILLLWFEDTDLIFVTNSRYEFLDPYYKTKKNQYTLRDYIYDSEGMPSSLLEHISYFFTKNK